MCCNVICRSCTAKSASRNKNMRCWNKKTVDFNSNSNYSKRSVRHVAVFEQTSYCYGVAVSAGLLYLPIFSHHVVDVLDASCGRVARWGTFNQSGQAIINQPPQFNRPTSVAVDETRGRLYVADSSNHCVVVLRLGDGVVEVVWGSLGSDRHQFQHPRSLAYCAATDQLYVADQYNHCVKVLRGLDGQCLQAIGPGTAPACHSIYHAIGVAVDPHHIYIVDKYSRVVVYSKHNGEFLFRCGQRCGRGELCFFHPSGVSVDSDAGVMYVADHGNFRICVYRTSDGSYLRHFEVLHADDVKAKPTAVMWDAASGVLHVTTLSSTTISLYGCS
eukprot:TRINITY_DN1194_c0_g1_i6.p2 TRINITY_DN1194_c0_g1~~TRINITY_DN1194_c0_g1_i6.p2  ORF type:complete len:330 (+),score=59.69 TRINITY_DN1194_c0_g1_i6:2111-3100(+)